MEGDYRDDRTRWRRSSYLDSWMTVLDKKDKYYGLLDLFAEAARSSSAESSCFYTMRLEHRTGGDMSRYEGEERILLFRSDRPGVIAKIVYSSSVSETMLVQAKVHVLDVKENYRGFDLGSLLFTETLASLRHRYSQALEGEVHASYSICCQLDAEEDTRRHGKLVRFYERLGCSIRPEARIVYMNNNDGETYRKVPMQIVLEALDERETTSCDSSLAASHSSFVPIQFCTIKGNEVQGLNSKEDGEIPHFLVVDDGQGHLQFLTTKGLVLSASSDDGLSFVRLASEETLCRSQFQLVRVAEVDYCKCNKGIRHESRRSRDLWLIRSCWQGKFLALDERTSSLFISESPTFWQVSEEGFKLLSTRDTPSRRLHYRMYWANQTLDYVACMRKRFLSFDRACMGLDTAIDLVASLPGIHFGTFHDFHGPSLRTRCFRTAEYFRNAGHPDWVQLLGLVYGLAGAVKCVDDSINKECENEYDWTLPVQSHIVGCALPSHLDATETHEAEADERPLNRSEFGSYQRKCGLLEVTMPWTGTEYMYNMLRHNRVELPEEAFRMLRLVSLEAWHVHGAYSHFANEEDDAVKSFITDFNDGVAGAREETVHSKDLSTDDCRKLWSTHYADIAAKYNMDWDLCW